ncbi:MAG: DUF1565 domain-containing protein [Synechococcaceae cyanobacterium RM1_1_27]|nr:DUF1565 domain-containing protein [Synechococcaceae cyanobacterium RM1_1_27]
MTSAHPPQFKTIAFCKTELGVSWGGNSTPKLRGNLISRNLQSGLVAITLGAPDLGTASDPGNNIFEGNGEFDVNNSTRGIQVAAFGNNFGGALKGEVSTAGQASVPTAASQAPGAVAEGSLTLPTTTPAVAEPPAETPVAAPAPPAAQPTAAQGLPTVAVPASESPVEQVPVAISPTPVPQTPTPVPTVAQQPASGPDSFQVVPFTPSGSEVSAVGGNPSSPASPTSVTATQGDTNGATLTDITTLLPPPGQRPAPSPNSPSGSRARCRSPQPPD